MILASHTSKPSFALASCRPIPRSRSHHLALLRSTALQTCSHFHSCIGVVMALDGIGFALGVIPEVRHQVTRIQERYANFVEGPATFQDLTSKLDGMASDKTAIEGIIQAQPNVVPEVTSPMFRRRLDTVKQCLDKSKVVLDELAQDAFPESSSKRRKKAEAMIRRAFRADAIFEKMESVANQVKEASTVLEGLVTRLTTCVKVEGMSVNCTDVHEEPCYVSEGSAPMLARTVSLDYRSKDGQGAFGTPEGKLKNCVLTSDSSSKVVAAAGIVGMAGVGKTIALQGLAHEEDILVRFPDGVHYMSLGHGATLQHVIRQIGKIMLTTGATIIVDKVETSSSIEEAVDYAVMWFRGRSCLFLIDDLWPTENRKTGYLNDLLQMLRGSPNSRMAITTRSEDIARQAGLKVDFGARNPHGLISLRLFMAHASGSVSDDLSSGQMCDSVSKILSCCAGLPIALAVTGCAVQFKFEKLGDFENACDTYATELEETKMSLGDEQSPGGTSLSAGIVLSLNYLDVEFMNWKSVNAPNMEHSVTDLYTGLCVLQNQAWVPLSVLCRLWSVDKHCAYHVLNRICALSLATLEYRKHIHGSTAEAGLILHDLHLDFCQKQSQRTNTHSAWHAQLLNGYLRLNLHPVGASTSTEQCTVAEKGLLEFTSREWWSVPEDGYIHSNISRHLSCAGKGVELAALLLDGRWTELRARIGGILAIKADFELLDCYFEKLKPQRGQEAVADIQRSFQQIFKTVRLSWGRHTAGWRAFQFQVCARLKGLRQTDSMVEAYLKSIEARTPKPYLVPINAVFPDVNEVQIMEIPVGGACCCVACSPCGRYIAAGAGRSIVVLDCSTGEILKRLHAHMDQVTCAAFLAGSKKIVSGSQDCKVMVWTWESSDTPTQVFQGHCNSIVGVAETIDDQFIISASGDRTVRAWDATAGTQTWQLLHSSWIFCVAVCAQDGKIAIGLHDGTLKVLDGATKETLFEDTLERKRATCASFSPNGSYLATVSSARIIRLWNTQTWTSVYFKGHEEDVTSVAFSPNSNQVVSSSVDGTIRLWDVDSGKCVGVSPRISSWIRSVSFTVNGERIVSGSNDGLVRIWDARLGNEGEGKRDGHNSEVLGVSISENGQRIASASKDGTVRLWDSLTGEQVGEPMQGHTEWVSCVSFSPEGRRLVSGSWDSTLRLWDTETHVQIGNLFERHTGLVHSVSFSSDGRRIISGSGDKSVRIWNAETHEQIGNALQGHKSAVECVAESTDGLYIVSRDRRGITGIWNRDRRVMIWTSKKGVTAGKEISNCEAGIIIRSCGPQAAHLWPKCLPEYSAELFCQGEYVHSNLLGEKTLIGNLPPWTCWVYQREQKTVAVGLQSGEFAILKLIIE